MKIHSFNVTPKLPENIQALGELTQNMWFTWNWDAILMFVDMDEDLWKRSHRNPKWVLGALGEKRISELSKDRDFVEKLNSIKKVFSEYRTKKTWFSEHCEKSEVDASVAYFSMEFGIGEGLPMYSGGLGMLAGDHLKSSSDLGLPLVGVGLFYQKGYIQQVLNRDGWQVERHPDNDWANMPVELIRNADGTPMTVEVPLGSEIIHARIWRVPVGRTSLYLLDTNLPENPPYHRSITEQLYGGDRNTRIRQEIVLGVGGVRALRAMGITPTVYHINEGHSAFLLVERVAEIMAEKHMSFDEAREAVWSSSVFTTHTPVIAGNEHFDPELVRRYMEVYAQKLGISWDQFHELGKETDDSATFCMTVLALKLCAYNNGVSKLHGEVSRDMWRRVWPGLPFEEIPVTSITNGVHTSSWISHELLMLYNAFLAHGNPEARYNPADLMKWDKIDSIPDEQFWAVHKIRKEKLINLVRQRYTRQLKRLGADVTVLEESSKILDPKVLTIGFARRFATYKRATLMFRDLDRLARVINNPERPIQLVFAGKAHQADTLGKELIKFIVKLMDDPRFKGKLLFLEDYNMNVARYLTQGVDIWLNNPVRPMEASGTSGMKSSINGVLNLSIIDGWWGEAGSGNVGWSIGGSEHYNDDDERDNVESGAICNLLEKEIAPIYYDSGENGIPTRWIKMMKNSVKTIVPYFNTHRMVREYYDMMYIPAHRYGKKMVQEEKARETAFWRRRIAANWSKVHIVNTSASVRQKTEICAGSTLNCQAKVWLGELSPQDVSVQLYLGMLDYHGEIQGKPIEMQYSGTEGDAYVYELKLKNDDSGRHDYAMRVIPKNANVPNPFTPIFIKWEE
ncbi:MAG: alpha-glucan family phosphorylase [Elusimicrobiaceae bacterium]